MSMLPSKPMNYTISKYQKTEWFLHLLFWVFIFTAVNVSWQQNWFDPSIRVNTPAPLAVLIFPFMFYAHAYWAIPTYLTNRKWFPYGFSILLIFIGPELLRLGFYALVLNRPPGAEIFSRDSFLFGTLNIAWIAFIFSLVYRLFVDRVFTDYEKKLIHTGAESGMDTLTTLSVKESKVLTDKLDTLMNEKQIFLSRDLKLGTLSDHLGIPEKKLSTLLNHHMSTNFSDYVNRYRVVHFLREVDNGKLDKLTISGLMNECGFSSKATFYRAFKKIKGCTPTEWLKSQQ